MQVSSAEELRMRKRLVLIFCLAFLETRYFSIEANTVKKCPPTCPFKYFEEEHFPELTFLRDDKRIKSIYLCLTNFCI